MDNARIATSELCPVPDQLPANGATAAHENVVDGEIREIVDPQAIVSAPLVSVLMVTYNHGQYIGAAIEGVLRQETTFSFEIIIGEDASTDSTFEIARQYQKRFPDKIRIIASARNTGLRQNGRRVRDAVRGKYVAYCDGDDFWHNPNKLQKQVDFLEHNPDYVLVHSNYDAHYVTRNRRIRNCILDRPMDDADAYHEILANRRMVLTVTVCLRAELLKQIAEEHKEITDVSWPLGDAQTWLEIARLGKVKYLPESLATYRYLPESATQSSDRQRVYRFRIKVRELMLHYLGKYECPPAIAREAKAFSAVCLMRDAYYARERGLMPLLLEDAQQHYIKIPAENWLYYVGMRNRLTHRLVAPGLLALRAINRIRRHIGRPMDLRQRPARPF